ncbi:thioredoxin family protein [Pseudomonadota bacterium]
MIQKFISSLTLFIFAAALAAAQQPLLTTSEELFLQNHWPDAIPPQGTPPTDYSALERSLSPEDCGQCHPQQLQDWSTSLHSKAMGPGIYGQLVDMVETDPATARICWGCHTPLAEQQDKLWTSTADGSAWLANKQFDKSLQHKGLVCAACHVRQHQVYGPVRSATPDITGRIDQGLPHDGFSAETAFSKSGFCRGCHQFEPTDYALNGKLIENTYNEWKESRYPAEGIQCQSCHMPKRRHLWRGIHDPEMVKQGITISVEQKNQQLQLNDTLTATIIIANTGVGHYFPTYLTPKVFVRAKLVDTAGNLIAGTEQEAIIGREATLDLSQELYDTRIPPGDSVAINYQQIVTQDNPSLKIEIAVEPDHFYEQFYRSVLANSSPSSKGRALLEQALKDVEQSPFTIYTSVRPLSISSSHQSAENSPPNWNDTNIEWHDYATGLQQACSTGKPVMLFFYADWCPTCHAYKTIFRDQEIVAATSQFIMVRVNIDEHPEINSTYDLDGDYVPRIFALHADGTLIGNIQSSSKGYKYFISANNRSGFVELMKNILGTTNLAAQHANHSTANTCADNG